MKIDVRLFARARDLAGSETIELSLPDAARVRDLKERLVAEVPALESLLPQLLIAIDEDYATDDAIVPSSASVACFPPVSGG